MVRTQIQLSESQLKELRRVSSVTGKSIAALIRQGVTLYLSTEQRANREEQVQRALRAAGKFSSGAKNTSTDHDRYLAEAFRG